MDGSEKRKFARLGVEFDLSCRQVGSSVEQLYSGRTVNISTGGLYFHTDIDTLKPGSLVKIDLSIPPESGMLEFGGRISGFGRILRTDTIKEISPGKSCCGVALEFCRTPQFCI